MTEESTTSAPRRPGNNRPARLSALETAAERGIGPLSPLVAEVWHGRSQPCVSCGELILRTDMVCSQCGQNHSLEMVTKIQAHSGPWYVHEHVRPFPGVNLDRLIRQARRGNLTPTTIVRGPTTYHQWRFAAETPGLSKYVGRCWNCQAAVTENDTYCDNCDVHLDRPPGELADERPVPPETREDELKRLSMALRSSTVPPPDRSVEADEPVAAPRQARTIRIPVNYVIAALLILAIVALLAVVRLRERSRAPSPPAEAVVSAILRQSPFCWRQPNGLTGNVICTQDAPISRRTGLMAPHPHAG
jgi:hypothetical protein